MDKERCRTMRTEAVMAGEGQGIGGTVRIVGGDGAAASKRQYLTPGQSE